MKLARILMLGLSLAVLAEAVSVEPVSAQCWDCQYGALSDENGNKCAHCVAGQQGLGAEYCATPRCTTCRVGGPRCVVTVMLDGRAAPAVPMEQFEATSTEPQAASVARGSANPIAFPRQASEIKRSCDGGIITKWYAPAKVSGIRSETAKLQL